MSTYTGNSNAFGQPQQVEDPFAMGNRGASLTFPSVGTEYRGLVVVEAPALVRSRNFESGQPESWPDGNPKMTAVVTVELDGETRSLWAPKPSSMFRAIAEAQQAAGARILPGGTLDVRYTHDEPNRTNPRLNPQKIYAVRYTPPVAGAVQGDPFAAPAQQQQSVQQPAAQPSQSWSQQPMQQQPQGQQWPPVGNGTTPQGTPLPSEPPF